MSTAQSRLEIAVDVFEEKAKRASIIPELTARELVEAIVQEFRALPYLSDAPEDYQLLRARDQAPLDPAKPLGQQLKPDEKLILVEHEPRLPPGTQRPTQHTYLREEATGKVYKLHWSPALIGRPDNSLANNEQLAVNLAAHERGLRVSRRHAQITEQNGRWVIESLSQNQTTIRDGLGQEVVLNGLVLPLEPGHVVSLDQSQIVLKLVVRPEDRPA